MDRTIFDRFRHFKEKRKLLEKTIPNYSLVPCISGTLNLYIIGCTKFREVCFVNSIVVIDPHKSPDAKWLSYHTIAITNESKVEMLCHTSENNLEEGLHSFEVHSTKGDCSSFSYPWKIKYYKTNNPIKILNLQNLVTPNTENSYFSVVASKQKVIVFIIKIEPNKKSKLKHPQFLVTVDISKSPDIKKIHWFSVFSKNTNEAQILVDTYEKSIIPKGLVTLNSNVIVSKKLTQNKDGIIIPFVYSGYWFKE